MKFYKSILVAVALTIASISFAVAQEYKLGDLLIKNPYARATPPNAPVSGGYMSITNNGTSTDRLISASVDFAGKTEIHEMKMDGDVMKMRRIEGGLTIPVGETVLLEPGGYHVMFMKLDEQLVESEIRSIKLVFEKAGEIQMELPVKKVMRSGMSKKHN